MAELENRVNALEIKTTTIESKVDAFIQEMRDFKTEMRDRDNQRAAEIREIRQSQEAMRKDMYALVDRMDQKIDGIGKFVQNLTVAAIVGIGAAVVGIGAVTVAIVMK